MRQNKTNKILRKKAFSMRQAEPNCSLIKVDLSFPYLQVLMQGRPRHDKDSLKHPPMDLVHRAKIFAPFDALAGYSKKIEEADRSFDEPERDSPEPNICAWPEDL